MLIFKSITWLLQLGDEEGDDALATYDMWWNVPESQQELLREDLLLTMRPPSFKGRICHVFRASLRRRRSSWHQTFLPLVERWPLLFLMEPPCLLLLSTYCILLVNVSMESIDASNMANSGGFEAVPASVSAIEALEMVRFDVNGVDSVGF
uniref:Uncharacterized protein n=1 Tax=Nelumbo nucifera TaxID=4432 RepID=A0A822YAS2_NELNU|nr:TPA_asm: hypothetical protein HUJ06_010055 [Nelumbo nucifera]